MLPKITRARHVAGRGPDPRLTEERAHGAAEPAAVIAATAMPQQGAVGPGGKALVMARLEQAVDFVGGVHRHGDQARLVKLRFPDRQRVLTRVGVAHGQPCELTPSHAGRVKEDDREPHGLGTQGRIGGAPPCPCGGGEPADLAVREDVRPDGLVDRREEALVRNKAAGLATPAIQTQISDLTHVVSTIARGEMLKGEAPLGERLRTDIGVSGGEELIEVRQYPFDHRVLSPHRSFCLQVALDRGAQNGTERRLHDATPITPRETSGGRSNATSRRSSTANRR